MKLCSDYDAFPILLTLYCFYIARVQLPNRKALSQRGMHFQLALQLMCSMMASLA